MDATIIFTASGIGIGAAAGGIYTGCKYLGRLVDAWEVSGASYKDSARRDIIIGASFGAAVGIMTGVTIDALENSAPITPTEKSQPNQQTPDSFM